MKFGIAKCAIAALTLALLMAGAQAQNMGGGGGGGFGGRKQHEQKVDKPAEQKPKIDEKAYAAALKALPDKKFDPWKAVR